MVWYNMIPPPSQRMEERVYWCTMYVVKIHDFISKEFGVIFQFYAVHIIIINSYWLYMCIY